MKNNTCNLIYQNERGYKVFATLSSEIATKRLAVEMYVEFPDGTITDIFTIRRSAILTKRNTFDFLFDFEARFDEQEVLLITTVIENFVESSVETVGIGTKMEINELWEHVSEYIRNNAKSVEENPDTRIIVKDGYGYIGTEMFDAYVKKHKEELGYSKFEILRRFKILGLLETNKGRNDKQVYVNGKVSRYLVMKLADCKEKKEEVMEL